MVQGFFFPFFFEGGGGLLEVLGNFLGLVFWLRSIIPVPWGPEYPLVGSSTSSLPWQLRYKPSLWSPAITVPMNAGTSERGKRGNAGTPRKVPQKCVTEVLKGQLFQRSSLMFKRSVLSCFSTSDWEQANSKFQPDIPRFLNYWR